MNSTRRIATAIALIAGASGLAMPAAQAATQPEAMSLSAADTLDEITTMGLPEEQAAKMPSATEQLNGLSRINELNQLHQITDLVAPVTNLVPSVQ
ncbi:hypothetical protein [Streptomyces sp. NPDC050504]|uniref:hypothetical protein n=1 Tax=Streptomyces sp. NPDC050504 TaxID=3365618 RepID=UPI0037AECCFD